MVASRLDIGVGTGDARRKAGEDEGAILDRHAALFGVVSIARPAMAERDTSYGIGRAKQSSCALLPPAGAFAGALGITPMPESQAAAAGCPVSHTHVDRPLDPNGKLAIIGAWEGTTPRRRRPGDRDEWSAAWRSGSPQRSPR
jgi:hypothetical protein